MADGQDGGGAWLRTLAGSSAEIAKLGVEQLDCISWSRGEIDVVRQDYPLVLNGVQLIGAGQ